MTKGKRFFFWFFLGIGCFIVFVSLILIILPAFLNLNFVKSKINQELKERYQVSTQIGSISVRFLPRPKVVLRNTNIASDNFKAFFPVVSGYPKLWPILHKKFEIDAIILEKAGLKFTLPSRPASSAGSVMEVFKRQRKRLSALSFKAHIQLKDASIEVLKEKVSIFKAHSINLKADIKDSQIVLETSFSTPFSKKISIKGRSSLSGSEGHAEVKDLRLEHLPLILANKKITKSQIDLELSFNFKSPIKFNLAFNIVSPYFKSQSPDIFLKNAIAQGRLFREENNWALKLSRLELKTPRIKGQGWLNTDVKKYHIAYDFDAQEIDVTGCRKLLLSVFSQNKAIKNIFNIVKAGKAKNFHITQTAVNKKEFEALETFKLQAEASMAEIDIPKVGLKILNGEGGIAIKEGVLYGENLSGIMEGAKLREAKIAIGIKAPHEDLNIEGQFTASLKTGLFFLKKFVKNHLLQKELKLISKSQGIVSGKLVIAGTYKSADVSLKGALVKGNILYSRLPYPVLIDKVNFSYNTEKICWQGLKGRFGHSIISNSKGEVDFSTPKVFLNVKNFSGKLIAHELNPWLKQQTFLNSLYQAFNLPKGEIKVSSAEFVYKFGLPSSLSYVFHFHLRKSILFLSFLPQKVQIERGEGFVSPQLISFNNIHGSSGNATFLLSGEIKNPFTKQRQIRLEGKGEITAFLQDWIYNLANISNSLKIKTPAKVKWFELNYNPGHTQLKISVSNPQKISLGLNLDYLPHQCSIKDFYLEENDKKCFVCLNLNWQKDPVLDLNFKGILSSKTLDAVLVKNKYLTGFFKGEINGKIDLAYLGNSELKGNLLIEGLSNINGFKKLTVEKMGLNAQGQEIEIKKCALSLKKTALEAQGSIKFIEDFLGVNGEIFASVIDLNEIGNLFPKRTSEKSPKVKINANIDAQIDLLRYNNINLEQIEALISIKNTEKIKMEILKGNYCNLGLNGFIRASKEEIGLEISLNGEDLALNSLSQCLFQKDHFFEANCSLNGKIKAKGKKRPIQENSSGYFEFHSEKGRIYKATLLAKIFSLLNVIEIFKGRLPDLTKEGLYYKHFDIKASLQNGILNVESAVIDSPAMKIVGQGTFDISNSELKMAILVAPLRTIDIVLSKIPILGRILTGKSKTFVSVPLDVKGPIQNPHVVLLPPSAIGKGILGLMKRIIGAPVEIFKPLTHNLKNIERRLIC